MRVLSGFISPYIFSLNKRFNMLPSSLYIFMASFYFLLTFSRPFNQTEKKEKDVKKRKEKEIINNIVL